MLAYTGHSEYIDELFFADVEMFSTVVQQCFLYQHNKLFDIYVCPSQILFGFVGKCFSIGGISNRFDLQYLIEQLSMWA